MIRVPPAFASSYLDFQNYSESHTSSSILRTTFRGYRERLDQKASRIFSQDANDIEIPIKEIRKTGTNGSLEVYKENIFDVAGLKRWLGDTQRNDLAGPTKPTGAVATKPDPVSRFM